MAIIQLIKFDFSAERIAVNPEQPGRARLIAVGAVQHTLDKFLFKFVDGFIEVDPSIHHLANQRIQLLPHSSTLRTRVVRRRKRPAARLTEFMAR